jgi:hypothetical protein
MKREVSFFKDKRATSAAALIASMRAVGMTDEEIKAELLKMQAERNAKTTPPTNDTQEGEE